MSNTYEDYANQCRQLVNRTQPRFNSIIADTSGSLLFKTEAIYAMQAMLNNELLAKTAFSNPVSMDLAMAQIAACGLTLDPAMQLAYLVPRDGKVIADISYRGLIDIAIRSRAVNLVTVKAVYSNDLFRYRGIMRSLSMCTTHLCPLKSGVICGVRTPWRILQLACFWLRLSAPKTSTQRVRCPRPGQGQSRVKVEVLGSPTLSPWH